FPLGRRSPSVRCDLAVSRAPAALEREPGRPQHWTVSSLMLLATLLVAFVAQAAPGHAATTQEIGPDDDWCGAARELRPGAELLLAPGESAGPCMLTHGGTPGSPIVIGAKDPADPPRIVQLWTDADALGIQVGYVTVRGLAFGPTRSDVDAV